MPPVPKGAPRVSAGTTEEPAKKRSPPTRPRGPSRSQQMTQIQKKNLHLLAQDADRDYLDAHVMPFLFVALQEVLEGRPDRPLAFLAERLLRMEEGGGGGGGDRPALPISWGPATAPTDGVPAERAADEAAPRATQDAEEALGG